MQAQAYIHKYVHPSLQEMEEVTSGQFLQLHDYHTYTLHELS